MKLKVVDQNAVVAEQEVKAPFLGAKENPVLVAQAVRVFLANQRRARARTKTRGEVAGSTRKIYRQKGTGRARHGDRQAPIFVGGGKAFGPSGQQNYQSNLNRQMARKALTVVLSQMQKKQQLFLLKEQDFKKTKEAALFWQKVVQGLGLKGKVAVLVSREDESWKRIYRNFAAVSLLPVESLSAYPLLRVDCLFSTPKAWEYLAQRYQEEK